MTTIKLRTVQDALVLRSWLRERVSPFIGIALGKSATDKSIGLGNSAGGPSYLVRLSDTEVLRAVATMLIDSERNIWSDNGTVTAIAVANALGEHVDLLDQIRCLTALKASIEPGAAPAKRGTSPAIAAAGVAKDIARMQATHSVEMRRIGSRFVRHDILWRPRQQRGWCLDVDALRAKTTWTESERVRLAERAGIDLTSNGQSTHQYLARNNIVVARQKDGEPSLSHRDFDRAIYSDDVLPAWNDFRSARLLKSSMDKMRELATHQVDGRVYSTLITGGVKTGRVKSVRAALQNVSQVDRPLLQADEGHVLVSLDLSAAEVKIAAAVSGDTAMAASLSEDPYLKMAVETFGAEAVAADPGMRKLFKVGVISTLYGSGTASLAAGLGISKETAKRVVGVLRAEWPALFAFTDRVTSLPLTERTHTIDGRPLPFVQEGMQYSRPNHIIQGSGASLMFAATERVHERLGKRGTTAHLGTVWLTFHDELVVQCRPQHAEAVAQILKEEMTVRLPCGDTLIELGGEPTILGRHWGK